MSYTCIIRTSVRMSLLFFSCVCEWACVWVALSSRAITFRRYPSSPSFSPRLSLQSPRSLTFSHSLTSCVSPFLSFFLFFVLYFSLLCAEFLLFWAFEAYFLFCCRMWGGGGAWGCGLFDWMCLCERESKRGREWFSQPYDLIYSSFLVRERQREGEGAFFFT